MTISFFNLACQLENQTQRSKNMSSDFTYEVEKADYDSGQKDELGEIDYDNFIKSFDEFPWAEQIEKANQIKKISPTLSVKANQKNETLWVSGVGDKDKYSFLIGHIYPKDTVKSFGQQKLKKWMVIYATEDKEIVKECFKLFFEGKTQELIDKFSKLEKFDEMEPIN